MKQSDLLIGEKAERNDFLERRTVLSTNNCKITEQSAVEGRPGTKTRPLSIEKLISPGASDEGQKRRRRGGGNKQEERERRTECGWAIAVFLSVQTFLLKNIPQVQYLLWSTKLPNVLISTANAAGKQEDRV